MTDTQVIKLMMADDNKYGRDFFCSEIEKADGEIKIIGKVSNGQELLNLIEKELPDVVMLDLAMPVLDGYKTLKIIKSEHPDIRVIIFSSYCSDYFITRMLLEGASAFIVKGTMPVELVETIRNVCRDNYHFSEHISKHVITTLMEENEMERILEENLLSDREIEILKLICNEKEAKEIADILSISEATVKDHKKNLKRKTKSTTSVGLVKYAIRVGLSNIS